MKRCSLLKKSAIQGKIVMGVRVRFKEARIHNRVAFKEKSTTCNTVNSWKSQRKQIYSTNNFCHFIKFLKSTAEENERVLLWIYSNTFISVSCPENAVHRKVKSVEWVFPNPLPIVQSPFQQSRFEHKAQMCSCKVMYEQNHRQLIPAEVNWSSAKLNDTKSRPMYFIAELFCQTFLKSSCVMDFSTKPGIWVLETQQR